MNFVAEGRRLLVVPHNEEGGVVARLPTRPAISIPSMAAQAAEASPGMVLSTTMFWARSKEVTPSLKMVRRRPAKLRLFFRPETAYR